MGFPELTYSTKRRFSLNIQSHNNDFLILCKLVFVNEEILKKFLTDSDETWQDDNNRQVPSKDCMNGSGRMHTSSV